MSSRRAIVLSVIVVFQGEGYGLDNPTLTKFIAMAAIIAAAASYTTSGDTIQGPDIFLAQHVPTSLDDRNAHS